MLLLVIIYSCNDQHTLKTGLEGKAMPSFNLLLMDSTRKLNISSTASDKPVVLFYFSPFCPYCRAQTQEILDDMKSLKNIQFYLLSNFPLSLIKNYYDQFELKKYPNIIIGQDYDVYFSKYFKAEGVPYMAIYNKEKILKHALMGKVSTSVIKSLAFE